MLTPYLPYPPASGGQIRTLNLLKYLKKNNHITLVSLYKNAQEKKYASYLESYCDEIHLCKRAEKPWQIKNILKSVLWILPFLIVRNYSREAKHTVSQLLKTQTYDVIHAETFYIMPHIPETHIPILLVEQTIEFKVYQHFISALSFPVRMALSVDIAKLKFWETYFWRQASQVATMSQSDKDIITSIEPRINPVIIPNGAGDDMFVKRLTKKNLTCPKLLFVGNFYWLQNTEAAEYLIHRVFPKLKKDIPGVQLIIAGQNAKKTITTKDKGIVIRDIKPDDNEAVTNAYQEATLFLAPILGPGGTRLKVLAAMASGVPIVSTSTGVEGLGVDHLTHVSIADTPDAFVDESKRLLSDETLYRTLQTNAYTLAKEQYSWKSISKKLETIYKTITQTA
jgi:glycosyltransferase involved in cell wall biosynthesis